MYNALLKIEHIADADVNSKIAKTIAKIYHSQDERNQNTARQEVYIYCKNYLKNYFKKCQK
jgi:hypothetical protein